jgi:hypothetical protein
MIDSPELAATVNTCAGCRLRQTAALAAVGGLGLLTLAAGPLPGSLIQPTAILVAQTATATVTGNQVFGDSYIVVDGAKKYAVLDIYVKSNSATDIFSSVYGVSSYKASWILKEKIGTGTATNSTKGLKHAGGSSWNPNYTGSAGAAWDSFVTSGMRVQTADEEGATPIALTADPGFSNFNSANASRITGAGAGNGPGWYPAAGATPATNPYCVFGYYNGASNIAKATTTIAGNGVAVGSSLDNMFMIARVSMDTADMVAGTTYQYAVKFAMTVVSDGTTRTGSTLPAFRVDQSLTFVDPCTVGPLETDCNVNGIADRCEINSINDTDGDGILDLCEQRSCDVDGSGVIDAGDIAFLLTLWDQTPAWGDLDGDGRISGGDLAEILLKFGQSA